MTNFLFKEKPFTFESERTKAFVTLKNRIVTAPIMITLDRSLSFEIMCDTGDITVDAILSQRKNKLLHVIYYANHVLNPYQLNYATIEKELWLLCMILISSCHIY